MSMRIHLIETGRHRPWHAGSTVWSTGAHAALVASVVAGAVPARTHERVEREVVYLLPTLPSAPRRAPDASLRYDGGDAGALKRRADGTIPVHEGRPGRLASIPLPSPIVPILEDSVVRAGSPVFVATELDRVVERDPLSAAPVYPEDLERQQIEGGVVAQWVVDSAGRVDTTSFRVVSATHPGFVPAVRAALPLMRFRAAELQGRAVAQLVQQEFMFRLRLTEPDSTRARRP